MAWITLQQASNISGKSERTIRHYITQVRKKHGDKFENDYYTYQLQENGKYTLLVKRSFITGRSERLANKNVSQSVAKVVSQDEAGDESVVKSQPSLNEIEDLVDKRVKLIREMHKEEIERIEGNHNKLLEQLEVGALRMIDQQNRTTELLKGQVNRLEQQLLAKDELVKTMIEEMRAMRLERNETVSNYIDVASSTPSEEQKTEAFEDVINESDLDDFESNDADGLNNEIDDAINSNMTFAEWMERSNKS